MGKPIRTEQAEPFVCAKCNKHKKARLTWSTPSGVVCNACYGWRVSRG